MHITKQAALKTYNTFGLDIKASELSICSDVESLVSTIDHLIYNPQPHLVLGGGSNLLFSSDYEGLIIHPTIGGIEVINEDAQNVWIEVGAGVEWDQLVEHCVNNNWFGIENLSYIPGNVGASPVQNIGAYGVEVKDCIESVKGIYLSDSKPFSLNNSDCHFEYRNSIFKKELKNKTVIVSVVFKLQKSGELNLSYGPVKAEFDKKNDASIMALRNTIIEIRKSKLPEPEEYGNAGSFFKNPIIDKATFDALIDKNPSIPSYKLNSDSFKIPAGWLIDQAGWKGKSIGGAAVHKDQALVLINKGNALPSDIIQLSNNIIENIGEKYNIKLEPEVNII